MIRRHWQLVVAAACLVGAAALGLLAFELHRWPNQIARDDRLFQATPLRSGLWQLPRAASFDPSKWILGIGDDLSYRRALQSFWVVRPAPLLSSGLVTQSDIALAQAALARLAESDPDLTRRSQALNLMGLTVLGPTLPNDTTTRVAVLRAGIADFLNAIKLDPGNTDAKENLELLYRLYQQDLEEFFGRGGFAQPGGGSTGGAGAVGSGY
jgi:hypothetical protein